MRVHRPIGVFKFRGEWFVRVGYGEYSQTRRFTLHSSALSYATTYADAMRVGRVSTRWLP